MDECDCEGGCCAAVGSFGCTMSAVVVVVVVVGNVRGLWIRQ